MAKISAADAKAFFISRGYSNVAASGIVGGLLTESGGGGFLNTGALNPGDGADGSNSVGIAQWNGSRATNMRNYVASHPELGDNAQLGFVDYELRNNPGNTGDALTYLNGANDPYAATSAFLRFERPAGYSASNPMLADTASTRLANTNSVFGLSGGDAGNGELVGYENADGGFTYANEKGNDLNSSPNSLAGNATTATGGIKAGQKGSDDSIAKAIVTSGNQQAQTLASATRGAAASAAASDASTNATNVSTAQTVMTWFSNRILQVAVFLIAGIFLLIGLYMFSTKQSLSLSLAKRA